MRGGGVCAAVPGSYAAACSSAKVRATRVGMYRRFLFPFVRLVSMPWLGWAGLGWAAGAYAGAGPRVAALMPAAVVCGSVWYSHQWCVSGCDRLHVAWILGAAGKAEPEFDQSDFWLGFTEVQLDIGRMLWKSSLVLCLFVVARP
jgi:hypothetical protein